MINSVVVLRINNIKYLARTTFTLLSLRIISRKENEDRSYRQRVADVILNAIQVENEDDKPSIDAILKANDTVFQQYIDAVVCNNETYRNYYNQRPQSESPCKRFCYGFEDYTRESMANILKQFSVTIAQSYQPMAEISKAIGEAVLKTFEPMRGVSNILAEVTRQTSQTIGSFYQCIKPALDNFTKMQEDILQGIKDAAKVWDEIDWTALEASFCKWGEYEWTIIGYAPLSFHKNMPENQLEADKQALQFFNKIGLELLFSDLRDLELNQKDLKSAIFCFNNKQYKACAMLLCSMIEAPLIKIQPIDLNSKTRRSVGRRAVIDFKNKKASAKSLEDGKLIYLRAVNVLVFLNVLFDDGKNFINEPKHLNRNFLNH